MFPDGFDESQLEFKGFRHCLISVTMIYAFTESYKFKLIFSKTIALYKIW